jgi:predicted ATPase/DNA-binding CsgD family transcriptional regulator
MVQNSSSLSPSLSFIGRQRETVLIRDQLGSIKAHGCQVVTIAGDSGIGKTRLLDWAHTEAAQREITTLRGAASDTEGMPSYLLFIEALGSYIQAASLDKLQEQVGVYAAVLSHMFPELVTRFGTLPVGYSLPVEQARLRLYEAVSVFLSRIAASEGLVLLLDDLQWADKTSLDLLCYIVRHQPEARLLILGAYREGEVTQNSALEKALAEFNRLRRLTSVTIGPLTQAEVVALGVQYLGALLSQEVSQLLVTHSEGNPFFVEELLRSWVETGAIDLSNTGWHLNVTTPPILPSSIIMAVRQRLGRLSTETLECLQTASIIGRSFDLMLLSEVMGHEIELVEERLSEAVQCGVIHAATTTTYRFSHNKIRECLYETIRNTRRQRLHGLIGQALERRPESHRTKHLSELAFHFVQGGDRVQGAVYAQQAAEAAMRAYAADEAAAHYRTVLELVDLSDVKRAALWMGLGDAAMFAGNYPQTLEAYQKAQETWLREGDTVSAARACSRVGKVLWRQEAIAEAQAAFEHALQLIGTEDSPDSAEILLQLADLTVTSCGRNSEGMAYAEQALAMVKRLGDLRLEATAYRVIGNIQARSNELTMGQASMERALALAQEMDDPLLVTETCGYLANICTWVGNFGRSLNVSLLRAQMAKRTHDLFQLRHVYSWMALQHILQGQWKEAEAALAQQAQILQGFQGPEPHASLQLYRAMLLYYQGLFSEAEQEISSVVEILRATGSPTLLWHLGWQGQMLAELERYDEALKCFLDLEALAEDMDEQSRARGNALGQLAVGYSRLGKWPLAAAVYAKLLPFQGQFTPILVNRGLAMAAFAGGNTLAARKHFTDAELQARQAGMHPELAITLLQHGLLESNLEPLSVTNAILMEGLRLCDRLGMQRLGERVLTWVGKGERAIQQKGSSAGLSKREIEVLHLLVQGMTNREIAETLVLSEKTVARHLTHIFNKMDVQNRAGAAAYAFRNNLI